MLQLIQQPDLLIHGQNCFDQLTLIVCLFAKYDFPAKWPQLNQFGLATFEQLFQNLLHLSEEDIPKVNRFLGFYIEVMKEQNKKKLMSSKGQFNKVAREHLKAVFQVWNVFSEKQVQMIGIGTAQGEAVELGNFNKTIFDIATKLDKCMFLVLGCGFNLNDLLNEPTNNFYVKVVGQLIEKLKYFASLTETVSQ